MSQQKHIINHLYELLIFLSGNSSVDLTTEKGYKAISHPTSSWPNFVFDVDFNFTTPVELSKNIEDQQLPNHIILNETQIETHENDLLANHFFPIAEWACLKLEGQPNKLPLYGSFSIKKITQEEDFFNFLNFLIFIIL